DVSLYAETFDGIVGVARSVDGVKYQVSWVEDVATAGAGERPIKLYDEAGYAALRKAQRGNEDTASVQPIATINLYHPRSMGAIRNYGDHCRDLHILLCSITKKQADGVSMYDVGRLESASKPSGYKGKVVRVMSKMATYKSNSSDLSCKERERGGGGMAQ
ncbi:SWI/SNF and RSC complex subunit Ssr4, partial [Halocaridina rubra]